MKKVKLFEEFKKLHEEFKDKLSFEMTGSPKPYWKVKSDFENYMYDKGFVHTRLNKKTDLLITSNKNSNTLKMQKAKDYDIPIYTYKELKDNPSRNKLLKKKLQKLKEIAD